MPGMPIPLDGSASVGGASLSSSFASKAPSRVNPNTQMSRIMSETIEKELKCRGSFEENSIALKKPRNPCLGELTARDDAPFLVPLKKVMKDNLESEKYLRLEKTRQELKETFDQESFQIALPVKKRDIAKLNRVHNLRSEVDREIDALKRVAEYKRELLQHKAAPRFAEEV